MERLIYKEHIPSLDPRLKRHVYHDSKSWNYKFDTTSLTVTSVVHKRLIPVLDQGNVGSCTGNAGIGCLGTDPYFNSVPRSEVYTLDEPGALRLYSAAEVIDGSGPYPPNDNGSYGLSIAKALANAGMISSYQHTFTLDDALKALSVYPIMVGMNWYSGMFYPQADGRIIPSGRIMGGHEVEASEIDAENQRVWFWNSWGESWGLKGRFYLTFTDFGKLLSQRGDVVVLIPPVATTTTTTMAPQPPAPQPGTADQELATAMKKWMVEKGL
jgi:hypothetical protein